MRIILLTLAGLLLGSGAALADPERFVAVSNHGHGTITELRLSAASDEDWGPDRLGGGRTIKPGETVSVRLPDAACDYDVQATWADGKAEERRGLDLCATPRLALDGSGAAAPGQAPRGGRHDAAAAQATLVNATPRTITQIFVSPPDADRWGDDRLGNDQLEAGGSVAVSFTGGCVQDVRVVYDNKSAEERRGLDLCVHARLHITPGWALLPELDAPRPPPGEGPGGNGGGNDGGGGGGGDGDGSGGGGRGGAGGGGDDHIRFLQPAE